MSKKTSDLASTSLFVISIMISIATNLATAIIPPAWEPYLWLAWPALLILAVISIFISNSNKQTTDITQNSILLNSAKQPKQRRQQPQKTDLYSTRKSVSSISLTNRVNFHQLLVGIIIIGIGFIIFLIQTGSNPVLTKLFSWLLLTWDDKIVLFGSIILFPALLSSIIEPKRIIDFIGSETFGLGFIAIGVGIL
jgi:hypothetical protein